MASLVVALDLLVVSTALSTIRLDLAASNWGACPDWPKWLTRLRSWPRTTPAP